MSLADSVLPLVRTRRGVHRWDVANDYGAGLHGAVHLLREATQTEPPADVLQVTQKAIDIACKVIMRADDSSGASGTLSTRSSPSTPKRPARRRNPSTSSSTG